MMNLSTSQLENMIGMYFWPFVRIAGCLMVAPIFGARFVPARLRIVLAAAVTLLVAPLLTTPAMDALSLGGLVITSQQLLIGVAFGFTLQLIFDAVGMSGQLLANSMGLSFAFNVDPQRGASTPAVGQLYMLLLTMTFLGLGGHLALLQALVDSFHQIPIGGVLVAPAALWSLVSFGSTLFSGALLVALPGVTALLIVNLAFGVMSRAAPSLNLFAVGFPISLICGLVVMSAGLPSVQMGFIQLIHEAFAALSAFQGGAS